MSSHTKIASRCLPASAAIAAAMALSAGSPVFAEEGAATAAPAPQHAAKRGEDPLTGTHIRKAPEAVDLERIVVFPGARLRPGDAHWTDEDASAPELPVTRDQDAASH